MTTPELRAVRANITDPMIAKLWRELQSFGYPRLTFDEVKQAVDDVCDGKTATGVIGVIVGQQIREALEDA